MAVDDRTSAYVWAWLPDATEPVVAGRVDEVVDTGLVTFTYGRSYLRRSDAIALFLPDLPRKLLNRPAAFLSGQPDAAAQKLARLDG